jgi:hypothetical protein
VGGRPACRQPVRLHRRRHFGRFIAMRGHTVFESTRSASTVRTTPASAACIHAP